MNLQKLKVIILGTGQLGMAFKEALPNAIQLGREQINFLEMDPHLEVLHVLSPELIINTVAYTAVDKAEDEEEVANKINGDALKLLADYSLKYQVPLIHFSTDYVYDGDSSGLHSEADSLLPANAYGRSKLKGDTNVLSSGAPAWIFRVSWVFSYTGNNFVKTMLRLFKEREVISVVSDQVGSPTSAAGIVRAVIKALENKVPFGIYNLRSQQIMSWFDFAKMIKNFAEKSGIELKIKEIKGIQSSEYPTKAKRPLNSKMNIEKLAAFAKMPDLESDLAEVINKLKV